VFHFDCERWKAHIAVSLEALHVRPSRCVTVEDKVAGFYGLVAGKAGILHRLADLLREELRQFPGRKVAAAAGLFDWLGISLKD
jgi:hypothetical protein